MLAALATLAQPATPYADLVPRWKQAAEAFGAHSAAVIVVKSGQVVHLEAWGSTDVAGTAQATPDTRYYIASITKTYTALAISLLEEQGKLKVSDPVRKYLPWFKLAKNESKGEITLQDLLSHSPGIQCAEAVLLDAYTGEITEDRFRHWLALSGTASGRTSYTNVHYTLLGRVIEQVTGKSWAQAMDDLVFRPLGLSKTTASASVAFRDGAAVPVIRLGSEVRVAQPLKTDQTMHAAGGLFTTPRDFAAYLQALTSDHPLLSKDLKRRMFTQVSQFGPEGAIRILSGFGRAWHTGSYRKLTPFVTHLGGYRGAAAMIAVLPERGIGVAIMATGPTPIGLLEGIVMIDVFDRELGLKDQPDILPPSIERAKQFFRQQPGEVPNLVFQKEIVPLNQLIGRYANPDLGTMTFAWEDGLLIARLGQMKVDLRATDKGYEIVGEGEGNVVVPVLNNGKVSGFDVTYLGRKLPFIRVR